MTHPQKRPIPRRMDAAHLSDRAFLRAKDLLEATCAANPEMPFRAACGQALRQAWIEDRERAREEHDAA